MNEKKIAPHVEDVKFLLCEDVRHERSGKLLIVGLFPGERVVVHNVAQPAKGDAKAVISSLCLLFLSTKGSGRFESRFEITSPDGRSIAEAKGGPVDFGEDKSATVYAIFRPFPVLAFGEHKVRIWLDETPYGYTFDIRRAVEDSPQQSPGKKRPARTVRRAVRRPSN